MKTKEEIIEIVKLLPRPLVGGVCYRDNDHIELRDSCYEMFKEVIEISNPTNIVEIGTHCGSASCLLLSLSNAHLTSIDIGTTWIGIDHGFVDWGYVNMGHGLARVNEVLRNYFPGRFKLFIGDSTNEATINAINDRNFQLAFVDGNHDYSYVKTDEIGRASCRERV